MYVVAEQGGPDALGVAAVPLVARCCTNVHVLSRATPLSRVGVEADPWSDRINLSGEYYDELNLRDAREAGDQAQSRGDETYRREMAEASVAVNGRASFEYERDLARLQSLRSEEERIRLLVKIRGYRFPDGGDCVYTRLIQRHLRRSRSIDRLGAHLLALEARPVPTAGMCREAGRVQEELLHEGN